MKSEPRMTTASPCAPRRDTRVPGLELTLKAISAPSPRKAAGWSLISWGMPPTRSLGRAAQLGSAFRLALGFCRLRLGFGFGLGLDRLDRRALDPRRLHPRRDFGARGFAC